MVNLVSSILLTALCQSGLSCVEGKDPVKTFYQRKTTKLILCIYNGEIDGDV